MINGSLHVPVSPERDSAASLSASDKVRSRESGLHRCRWSDSGIFQHYALWLEAISIMTLIIIII